jgi:hypothetical protein
MNRTAAYLGLAGIGEKQRQLLRALARNFTVLAAARAEKQKGRGRGRRGVFMDAARRRLRQGLMRIEEGSYDGEETVSGVDFGQRRKTVTWPGR